MKCKVNVLNWIAKSANLQFSLSIRDFKKETTNVLVSQKGGLKNYEEMA